MYNGYDEKTYRDTEVTEEQENYLLYILGNTLCLLTVTDNSSGR